MISNEEIESFLHGNDPEEFIVAIEFDYASNSIYKVKEIPGKGKEIRKDTFTPFAWVGDLRGIKFYNDNTLTQNVACVGEGGEYTVYRNCEFYDSTRLNRSRS